LRLAIRAAAFPLALLVDAPARADATAGCIAANDSAIQLRTSHKLSEARAQFLRCAEAICPAELREACVRSVAEVNASIPTIVFVVKDAAGTEIGAVKIAMDGLPWVDRLDGSATAVDPGDHSFTFEIDGKVRAERRLMVHQGEKDRRESVVVGIPVPPTPTEPSTPVAAPPARAPAQEAPLGINKALGLVVGGAGVAGIAVGSVFGLMASSKWSQAKSDCAHGCLAGSSARSEHDDASTDGTTSTIAFVAGGAALAAGFVFFLSAPAASGSPAAARWILRPAVGANTGSVTLQGAW
jgi:hypothetical protein